MTYTTREEGLQSGEPVELYDFAIAAPPAIGTVVFRETWQYADVTARDAAWAKTSSSAQPYDGGATGGHSGQRLHVGVALSGIVGGGYAKHTRVLTAADGIEASKAYLIIVENCANVIPHSFEDFGVSIAGGDGRWVGTDNAGGSGESGTVYIHATSTAGATLTIALGVFDLEYGSSWIVYFGNVFVTDPSTVDAAPAALRYTSADVDVTFGAAIYTSAILTRARWATGGNEAGSSNLEVTIPRDHALVSACGPPPLLPCNLTVTRVHRPDAAAATSYVTPWRGQLVERRFDGPGCTLVFAPLAALLERRAPRYLTQRTCGHMLYDALCQASRLAHTSDPLPVGAISGRVVTVTGAGALAGTDTGMWANGILIAPDGTMGSIEATNGDDLTLKLALPGLAVADQVTLVKGCDKAVGTCNTRFANAVHFGGEPVMPIRNPGTGAGLGVSDGSAA